MISYDNIPAGTVIPIDFNSFDAAGGSVTITGLAVTDIEIYKDTSMTQRASDNGYTLLDTDGIDLDGVTGIQGFSIDLSDNSDSGFYAVGSFYRVVVSAVTIDGETVSFTAYRFRIVPAESSAGVPKVDVTHFGGSAGTFSSGRPEVNTSHLAGTAYGSADFSATMKASINTEADTALSDYDPPTNAEMVARTLAAASYATAAGQAAIEADTQDIQSKIGTPVALDGGAATVGGMLTKLADDNGGADFDATTDSQQAIRDKAGDIETDTQAIEADTNELQADWANGGRLDLILDARASQTSVDDLPTANENADALLDRADAIETGITPREAIRAIAAITVGEVSGAGSGTETFKGIDSATDRVEVTVDNDGNRTAVTLDP